MRFGWMKTPHRKAGGFVNVPIACEEAFDRLESSTKKGSAAEASR